MTMLSRWLFLLLMSGLSDCSFLSQACGQVTGETTLNSKLERQIIDYQPMFPDEWQKLKRQKQLVAWEGERVVFLTESADLNPATMTKFVQMLDGAWKVCGDATGFSPPLTRSFRGKPIIAAVPDRGLTRGSDWTVVSGAGGAEIATFYGPDADYERFKKMPGDLPGAYYNLIAECHNNTSNACVAFSVGSRQLSHLCREESRHSPEETQQRRRFKLIASAYAASDEVIAADFTNLNQYRRFQLHDTDGSPLPETTPIGTILGSIVLALRHEHDSDAWTARFYRHLASCPRVFDIDKPAVHSQLLHFTIASGLASQADPVKTFRDRFRFPGQPVMREALSKVDWDKPDLTAGDVLAALPGNTPQIPDPSVPELVLKGHEGEIYSVAFSPDGRTIASSSDDQTARVWDAGSGKELLTLRGHLGEVFHVAFAPDGKRLATADTAANVVKLWDLSTGRETLTLKGHTRGVMWVAFSPNGKQLASASGDGTARIRDATSGETTLTITKQDTTPYVGLFCVAFSPDGKRIVVTGNGGFLRVVDAARGQEQFSIAGGYRTVEFSPDGKLLAAGRNGNDGDRDVVLLDSVSGRVIFTMTGHELDVHAVAFSPDGKTLASASQDMTFRLWDIATGKSIRTTKAHDSHVTGVAFSPDGRRLASASLDGTVKVWNVSKRELNAALRSSSSVAAVASNADGL